VPLGVFLHIPAFSMKQCRSCGVEKPLSEYHLRSDTNKHQNGCKTCYHSDQMRRNYGITLVDYDRMYEEQSGLCAICHLPQISNRNTRFCVDHNHTTGEVRGLLCDTCNRGIGLLKDDPRLLTKAADYIRSFKE